VIAVETKKTLRVVHYVNQFFGQIGGEEKAGVAPQAREGAIGPAVAANNLLGQRGEVVATVLCGDNYFVENVESAIHQVLDLIAPYKPDLVLAGPAFNAGTPSVACGAVCQGTQTTLGVPGVTAMYQENPGADLYHRNVYIVRSGDSAREMAQVLGRMIALGLKLVAGETVGRPAEEGYFPRGTTRDEVVQKTAAVRAVDMLLSKIKGEPFETETPLPRFDRVPPPPGVRDLSQAVLALVTDGGLVPRGNPDRIERSAATRWGAYSIEGLNRLNSESYDVAHIGYDTAFVKQDPHRLVPLDAVRQLVTEKAIGRLHEVLYTTTGVGTTIENSQRMGREIAERLRDAGLQAVLLTST